MTCHSCGKQMGPYEGCDVYDANGDIVPICDKCNQELRPEEN